MFGDITTGRVWYADRDQVIAADDGKAKTVAPIHELDAGLRRIPKRSTASAAGRARRFPGWAPLPVEVAWTCGLRKTLTGSSTS